MTYKILRRKINTLLSTPGVLFLKIWYLFEPVVSDETFLRVLFRIRVGYWPNLKKPRSFNEKLQWLKLNYKRPEYTEMVDKVAAKDYIARIVGNQFIIPTLGVWDNVNDIDWNKLPNQFVLKAAHDSGGIIICKDKSKLDIAEAKAKLIGTGNRDYTKYNKEYAYKNVPHRFIAEEYMEDESGYELKDYKFFCFNGVPMFFKIDFDRQTNHRANYYDTDWVLQPFYESKYPYNPQRTFAKPENFDKMLEIVKTLSKKLPFVRIDLYNIRGEIYFGEMTFFPASGLGRIYPCEWDFKIGDNLILPSK